MGVTLIFFCVTSGRVVTVQSHVETRRASTTCVTCLQWGNQVTTGLCPSCMPRCWWQHTMEPRAGMQACQHWRLGEPSLVLTWWRWEFVLLSYSHTYCSKRNLKELDEVTKREEQIWKRVFKASWLGSMSQLQSSWLSAHSLPPFFFSYKRQM